MSFLSGTPGRREWVLGLAGLVISVVAAWLAVREVDIDRTLAIVARAQAGWLGFALIVIATQTVARTLRWRLLLPRASSGELVPVWRVLPVTLVGYLGNAVLPARLGEPLRAVVIARREGLPAAETLGCVLLERVVDTLTLAAVGSAAALALELPSWVVQVAMVGLLASLAALALLVVAGNPNVGSAGFVARAARSRSIVTSTIGRVIELVSRILRGGGVSNRPGKVLLAATLSLLAWALDATIYWSLARSLGLELAPLSAVVVSAVAVLSTAVPSAPGYLGTFELAVTAVAGVLGIAPDAALAFALGVHAVTVVPIALAGGLALLWVGRDLRTGPLPLQQEASR